VLVSRERTEGCCLGKTSFHLNSKRPVLSCWLLIVTKKCISIPFFQKSLPKVAHSDWEGGCVCSEGDHYDHHECFTLTSFYGECVTRNWLKITDSLRKNPEEQQRLHQTERTRGRQWKKEARQQVNKHCNQRQLQWDTNTVFHFLILSLENVIMSTWLMRPIVSPPTQRGTQLGQDGWKKHSLLYNFFFLFHLLLKAFSQAVWKYDSGETDNLKDKSVLWAI